MCLVRPPIETDNINILHQHNVCRNLGNATCCKANHDDAPAPGNATKSSIKGVTSHGIVDHISPAAAGNSFHPLANVFLGIVDEVIGPMLLRDGQLLCASGTGNYPRAHGLSDLNGRKSHAS